MFRTISAVVFVALIAVYGSQGRADESGSMQCMNVMKAMKFAFQGVSPRNLAYSLKRDGETRYMLYVSAYEEGEVTKDDVARMPWRLLERQGSSETYCLIGAGNGVEGLRDIRDFETNKRYGMPGSGFARCTDSSDGAMASLKLRAPIKNWGIAIFRTFGPKLGRTILLCLTALKVKAEEQRGFS